MTTRLVAPSSPLGAQHVGRVEGCGEIADRIFARAQDGDAPARAGPAIMPLCSEGISPERTSEDLPLPDAPTTVRKRVSLSRRSSSSLSFSRPKKR